jgi:hypothetical protein
MTIDLEKLYGLTLSQAQDEANHFGYTIKNFPIEVPNPSNGRQFFEHSNVVAVHLKDNPQVIGVWERDGKIVCVFGRYDPAEGAIV